MTETVLSIVLVAGVIVIAATVRVAAKSAAAKRAQAAGEGQPDQAQPEQQQTSQELVPAGKGASAVPRRKGFSRVAAHPGGSQPPSAADAASRALVVQNGGSDVLTLLQEAHEQLSTRQHRIESELARIEQLRGEREALALQSAALHQAMKVFGVSPGMSHRTFETDGSSERAAS